jgi:D-serine deaminase-like pyridoxal phosphate-dependent protein
VTVATVDQVETMLGWGHSRVLIANQVVDRLGLSHLWAWLDEDTDREIRCLVDSTEGVRAAKQIFGAAGPSLEVLLDVGTPGGRTGVRGPQDARRLAQFVAQTPGLTLVGVAGYEGVAPNTRTEETIAAVDEHCRRVRDVYLDTAKFFETDTPIFSMGGSAFPDRVIEFLPTDNEVPNTIRVLRSGCYATHDHGTYARVSAIPELIPALSVRAVVLSVPEPGTAVVGAGKRDLSYDAGLPVLLAAQSATGTEKPEATGTIRTLYDHHAVLTEAADLEVTDIVEFGLSHPCSVFDRWSDYLVTNADGDVIDLWHTEFRRASIAREISKVR